MAVKKNGVICIASDTMTISGGSRKHTLDDVADTEKIIKWGSSYIGTAGHPTWSLVLQNYVCHRKQPALSTKEQIFEELLKMHEALKEKYHFSPSRDDDDAFEPIGFESLIVNAHGIFQTYYFGSLQQFIHFAAVGTGAAYALGALHALYDRLDSAEEIAKKALAAVVEFDDSSGFPGVFYTVKSQ
ncbi:MAG: hypothetical protein JSR80_00415 [Verrucomicrobia bacterium]|nr:hypothetical protein [Verrucomicrobiota bacterium]